jgi:hypothetical protein
MPTYLSITLDGNTIDAMKQKTVNVCEANDNARLSFLRVEARRIWQVVARELS